MTTRFDANYSTYAIPAIGVEVPEGTRTAEEAIETSHLDWSVCMKDAYTEDSCGDLRRVPSSRFIVREDTDRVIGVTGTGYTPFQNRSAFDFLDSYVADNRGSYGMCGEIAGGAGIFITLDLKDQITIKRNDGVSDLIGKTLYGLLFHNGSGAVKFGLMAKRMFCQNQLPFMLRSRDRKLFSFRHSSAINDRVAQAADAFREATGYFEQFARHAQRLSSSVFDREDMIRFSKALLVSEKSVDPELDIALMSKIRRGRVEEQILELTRLFQYGRGNTGSNKWDALNAVTDYVDHIKVVGQKTDTRSILQAKRADDLFFGSGYKLKYRALVKLG